MKVLANDSITLTKIIDGADGTNSISVILSSYAINLPSNSEGAIIDYSNSQVNIIVLEGQKSLIPTLSTSLNNGQFRLKNTTLKNIGSIAQPTIDKDKIKTGVISQFASNQDSGSAEFEIEYKTSTGDINTVNMTLTFTKAKQGLAGTPGKDGKPVFTSIRYSNEICDRENFIPTTATINPNADTFSIGIYTGEIDYDSPNNHWEQNLDKYKWSAYGQQSIKEIKTTFKATSSMNKPNSIDFRDDNIPSDFNAQNKYLWKKDVYYYNGTNTTTESINLIATYGKDGQSANTLSATSGSYSINKSEVIITGNSAHTDALNSTGTNLFVYNYDGSLAEKINYNTYSDPNLCNTLLTKIQGLRDKIFVLMECDSGSMTQQLRNELILSGGSQTDIWNKQRRAWIFISLSKKSTNNQYPLQKGQAYEVSNIGDNKKESLTVSLTGSGIVANGSTGIGITSIQTKYQATNSASKPTQGWGDSIWSTTIPALTDDKKYLYSITRYTYSDNRTTDIIDLISVKGSDGENGKILYQDTVPVAPSIGTQWFNTGTNNGYINNTLYVFDGQNWEVMEFSAENIKTNVLNALQANMDNTNVSHKLIVGNKTGKRVELDGYNGTLTIYNSNNQKVFYTGADGNLNFQGNLSFSSGSSVSQAIDKKADTSYVNNKVDGISIGGINLLNGTSNFDNKYWIQRSGYPATQLLPISPKISDAPSIVQMDKVTTRYSGKLYNIPIFLEKDKTYTISVYIKGDGSTSGVVDFAFLNLDTNDSFSFTYGSQETIGNNWKRIVKTFKGTGKTYKNFYMRLQNDNLSSTNALYIAGYQLEEGNKLTSYSPSPEDKASQSDLNSTNEKIDNISIGGTNLLQNSEPMPTLVTWPATQDSMMDSDWQKFTTNISGKEILPKDNAKYMLQLQANMDIVQSIMVQTDGQVNSAQFTFYDNAHHVADTKIKLISDGNGIKTYQLWCNYRTNGNKFRCIDLKTINYTGSYIKFNHPMIEQGNIPTGWSPDPRDTQTQINQTKDKISLIADIKENESDLNPDAAINVYIDKSQPEGHQGTVSIGANNKFLINANTKIGKDFVLDAGKIESKSDFYLDLEQKWNSLPPLDKDSLRSISDYLTSFNLTTGYQNWSSTLSNNINYIDQSNIYSLPINRTFSTNGDLLFKQDTLEVMGAHTTIYESPYQNTGFIGMDNFKFNQKTVDTENTTKELSIKLLSNKARLNFTSGQPYERVWETGGAYIGIDGRDNPKINDNPRTISLSSNKYKAHPSNLIANYNEEDGMITFKPIPNVDQELLLNDYNQTNASLSKVSGQWTQQVVIETDGDLKGAIFTWFDGEADHPVVATIYQLNNNRYMLESTYETSSDKTYRMCDFKKIEIEKGTYLSFVSLQYFENSAYRSALAVPTIYIDRLQSLNDEGDSHIGIDDDVLFRENAFNNGFYMGRKDTNYTEIGSAKDRNHRLAFLTTPGLTIGNSKNIYHNLVPVGTGNIIAFSNDNNELRNWDNNRDVGSAYILCKAATEISNKDLKVETKNTDVIEKATNDILKINAREYHFKNDIKLIQQWESEGEPEGKFATIDTQSDIGLFAEDLMEYSSLQSLLNITEDEFGNQSIVGVNYSRLSVILLEVLKKQEKRITNLEEELVKLKIQK